MSLDHHAYVIFQTEGVTEVLLKHVADEFDIETIGNPDVLTRRYENFGIADAKNLTEMQSRKSITAGKQVFIIVCESMTLEAQNALLKTFEEPTQDTVLFLCVPSRSILIPTLLSRLEIYDLEEVTLNENDLDVSDFITASGKERLEIVATLIEAKNKNKAQIFVNSVMTEYAIRDDSVEKRGALKELLHAEKLLGERGSSIKLVLEHLALTL